MYSSTNLQNFLMVQAGSGAPGYTGSSGALAVPNAPLAIGENSSSNAAFMTVRTRNATATDQYLYLGAVPNNGISTPSFAIGQQTGANSYSERLRIDQNGNVGIGTTTPQAALDVAITTSGQSAILVPRDTAANRPPVGVNGMIRYNTNAAALEAFANGSWATLVGAGTGSYLPLAGGTMTGAILDNNGTAPAPSYSFTSSTGTGMYSSATNNLSFASGGVQRMNIDQLGNVTVPATRT